MGKRAQEKRMLKVTRTTGSCRTHGVRAGAIMASLSSKSKMAMVYVALIRTEFTGPTGTMIQKIMTMMIMMTTMTKMTMIQGPAASLTLYIHQTKFSHLKTSNMDKPSTKRLSSKKLYCLMLTSHLKVIKENKDQLSCSCMV